MTSKLQIYISGDRLFSNSEKAFQLEDSKKLGEKKENKIVYSEFEALYLKELVQAEIIKNNKKLTEEQLIKLFSKKDFKINYLVYKYLRKKGLIVKTGSKFGAEFRVYEKNNQHAKYLVYIVKQSEKLNLHNLISKIRISHSTGKKLLLAILDSEEEILFYEIDWKKI